MIVLIWLIGWKIKLNRSHTWDTRVTSAGTQIWRKRESEVNATWRDKSILADVGSHRADSKIHAMRKSIWFSLHFSCRRLGNSSSCASVDWFLGAHQKINWLHYHLQWIFYSLLNLIPAECVYCTPHLIKKIKILTNIFGVFAYLRINNFTIYGIRWMKPSVKQSIFLIGNQEPIFVLKLFFTFTKSTK